MSRLPVLALWALVLTSAPVAAQPRERALPSRPSLPALTGAHHARVRGAVLLGAGQMQDPLLPRGERAFDDWYGHVIHRWLVRRLDAVHQVYRASEEVDAQERAILRGVEGALLEDTVRRFFDFEQPTRNRVFVRAASRRTRHGRFAGATLEHAIAMAYYECRRGLWYHQSDPRYARWRSFCGERAAAIEANPYRLPEVGYRRAPRTPSGDGCFQCGPTWRW